jgi:hypothetical protein
MLPFVQALAFADLVREVLTMQTWPGRGQRQQQQQRSMTRRGEHVHFLLAAGLGSVGGGETFIRACVRLPHSPHAHSVHAPIALAT